MPRGFQFFTRGLVFFAALLLMLAPVASTAEERFRVATSMNFSANRLAPLGILQPGEPPYIHIEDCPDLTDPRLEGTVRMLMEFLFLCHALRQGDVADEIEFIGTPNQPRALTMLDQGLVDAYYASQPIETLVGKFANILISDPILETDQFAKAVFTTEGRKDILAITSREEFLTLTGVIAASWLTDIEVLKNIPLAAVITAPTSGHFGPMIAQRRADITIAHLHREVLPWGKDHLHRVDGFRVRIPVTRNMVFAPHQAEALAAMQTYIRAHQAMDPNPLLEAYYHVGFLTRDYDHWEVLNPAEGTQTPN